MSEQEPQPEEPPDIFNVGDVLCDMYEIRGVLGAGGMGQVFEAQDMALARRVAIKASWPHLADSPIRKEAQALAAIRHPSMVGVYSVGAHAGIEFVVMERVFGTSLEGYLHRKQAANEPLSIVEALDLLIAIGDGLTAVHGAGIAHRDVKPANVMLAPGGRVVLMDFGLFLPEFEVAAQITIAGSPQYMAPEAISNTVEPGAGALVDLYALGVLAFELLTQEPPFTGETADEVWDQHLNAPVPNIGTRRKGLPPSLVKLITDLLAKDPSSRPQTADGVVWQLKAARASVDLATKETPFSVLVVESDREAAEVLGFYAKKAVPDADVRTAFDGESAIDAVRQRAPDVMLLELQMEEMNGVEVCMCLKGEGLGEKTVMVAVSAGAQEHDLQLLQQLGITHFIHKGPGMSERVASIIGDVRKRLKKG